MLRNSRSGSAPPRSPKARSAHRSDPLPLFPRSFASYIRVRAHATHARPPTRRGPLGAVGALSTARRGASTLPGAKRARRQSNAQGATTARGCAPFRVDSVVADPVQGELGRRLLKPGPNDARPRGTRPSAHGAAAAPLAQPAPPAAIRRAASASARDAHAARALAQSNSPETLRGVLARAQAGGRLFARKFSPRLARRRPCDRMLAIEMRARRPDARKWRVDDVFISLILYQISCRRGPAAGK